MYKLLAASVIVGALTAVAFLPSQISFSLPTPVVLAAPIPTLPEAEPQNIPTPLQKTAKKSLPVSSPLPAHPAVLLIPSIGLDDRIVDVGLTAEGDMDVPDGATNDVGWYKGGTIPGTIGSAVLDAHVFAAFSQLHRLRAGDDLYVLDANGLKLHFKVTSVETYALADVPARAIFTAHDAAHLNLITCAGNLTADHSTYDHRLVIYTTLVD